MATSSTYTESRTAKQIIDDALYACRAQDVDRTASSPEIKRCVRALNDIIFQLQGPPANYSGIKMWQKESYTLTYVADYNYYIFNPGTATTNNIDAQVPVEILGINNKDTSYSSETPMSPMTFNEYLDVSNKTDEGLPDKYYYENRIATGYLYFNREPSSTVISNYNAVIYYRQPLEIITAEKNTIDAPNYWLRALKWMLAREICPSYPGADREMIMAASKESYQLAVNFNPEEVVAYFQSERIDL